MLYLSDNLRMRMEFQQLRQKKLHKSERINRIMDYIFGIMGISIGIISFIYLVYKTVS